MKTMAMGLVECWAGLHITFLFKYDCFDNVILHFYSKQKDMF